MPTISRALLTGALALLGALAAVSSANAAAPRAWELALSAPPKALVSEPLEAIATVSAPPVECLGTRGWGCLTGAGAGAGAGAASAGSETAACLAGARTSSRGVSAWCQGWGDSGIGFHLYGPDDATCSARPLFTSWVAPTAAVAGSYRSAAFVPQRAGSYRWTASFADVDHGAPAIDCAAAAVVAVSQAPSDPPEQPPVDPGPPPVAPPPPDLPRANPEPPALPAAPAPPAPSAAAPLPPLARVALTRRCVRPAAGGRTTVTLGLTGSRTGRVLVRIERALGTKGRASCPSGGSRGIFEGRFRTVATLRRTVGDGAVTAPGPRAARSAAHAASAAPAARPATSKPAARPLTLNLRLQPALYRITVRAVLRGGKLSAPKRRYLRVLEAR